MVAFKNLGVKAGNGFNPDKYPSVAKVDKFTTPIATIYNKKIANMANIMISSFSALNFNFMCNTLPLLLIVT